jgi:hypothetical protein
MDTSTASWPTTPCKPLPDPLAPWRGRRPPSRRNRRAHLQTPPSRSYPGWDVYLDPRQSPAPQRIAFGGGDVGPVTNGNSKAMACGTRHSPAPGGIAEVRAGSNVTFFWSHWLYSHKGPITAWMAPYEGDIAGVDVNELEFVKFAEDTVDGKGVWANVRMMDEGNGTWTAQIPADIKPGNYVVRHEVS